MTTGTPPLLMEIRRLSSKLRLLPRPRRPFQVSAVIKNLARAETLAHYGGAEQPLPLPIAPAAMPEPADAASEPEAVPVPAPAPAPAPEPEPEPAGEVAQAPEPEPEVRKPLIMTEL